MSRRLERRLVWHHLPLAVVVLVAGTALYFTRPYPDIISRLSFATAYPALVLLAATLAVGPWNLLRRRANPVSSDLRRDLGIWAGIACVAHSVVGQCVHLRGRPWLYYVYGPTEHHTGFRHDLFGFSNYSGLLGFLLVILLFATSNDLSLRRLGRASWKRLQRWNYGLFAVAAAHSAGYLVIEKQHLPFVSAIALCVAITLGMQAAGFLSRHAVKGIN